MSPNTYVFVDRLEGDGKIEQFHLMEKIPEGNMEQLLRALSSLRGSQIKSFGFLKT